MRIIARFRWFDPAARDQLKDVSWSLLTGGVVLAVGLTLANCTSPLKKQNPFAGTGSPMYKKAGPLPKGGGRYHVGKPYEVAGKKFYPQVDPTYDKTGTGSWYGPKFHRRMTSNGEWFDMDYRSAAHPTLPIPSYAKVTNLENGRQLIVRVNDRGPFVGTRIVDLSRKSAEILDFKRKGKATVRVQYIGPAPLNDKGTHLAAMNREMERGTPLRQMIAAADGHGSQITSTRVASADTGATGSGYFVQVAAFGNRDNAARTRQSLSDVGPVIVTPVNGSLGTIYRVRVGPIGNETEAHQTLDRVVAAGHGDARVVFPTN